MFLAEEQLTAYDKVKNFIIELFLQLSLFVFVY